MLYYNTIILWDHRLICGLCLTETSICGARLYLRRGPISTLRLQLYDLGNEQFLVGLSSGESLTTRHETSQNYAGFVGFFSKINWTKAGMNKLKNFLSSKTLRASQGNHSNNRNTGNLNVNCKLGTAVILVPTKNKLNISDRKTRICK
jgi:hypothetical protein